MHLYRAAGLLALIAAIAPPATPAVDERPAEDGFVPLFNGKDLSGWVNVNCAPETFFVKDGQIITTGRPTGYLRTAKQYENFVAEFEWMHVPAKADAVGNSGFFVWADALPAVGTGYTRGIEVQVLVNLEYKDKATGKVTASSHGDLFSIHGATCVPDREHPAGWPRCLPSEDRARGANEWNHYRVEAIDGTIKLAVNGKVVSGVAKCNPRKGYLALEAEGSECRFKNLKIKELPSSNPKADEVAKADLGDGSLFTGLDLRGWKGDPDAWKAEGGVLRSTGKGNLTRDDMPGPSWALQFDWKVPASAAAEYKVLAGGKETKLTGKAGVWNRAMVSGTGGLTLPPAEGLELRSVFGRREK